MKNPKTVMFSLVMLASTIVISLSAVDLSVSAANHQEAGGASFWFNADYSKPELLSAWALATIGSFFTAYLISKWDQDEDHDNYNHKR